MKGERSNIADRLLASEEPAIQYLTRVQVLGESPTSRAARRDRAMIPRSPLVRAMFSHVDPSPYRKWTGPHWILAFCSELGYPPGDRKLKLLADRCAKWALGIQGTLIDGRWRRCGSQQGYALLYLMKLGFRDARCDELVERLLGWQWPDGRWNCDKRPEAVHSSFHETLLPMRAGAMLKKTQLDGGGFASSAARPYKKTIHAAGPHTPAALGPYGPRRMNPFVTIDALYVIRQAAGARGSAG
jgi:hypothetical protein